MNEVIDTINQVGFPIFVAVWMLFKDQKEKELTRRALAELTLAVSMLKSAIHEKEDDAA